MPWIAEAFSAQVLEGLKAKRRRDRLVTIPYYDGLMAGEPEALVNSFVGEPEVHHPARGRVKGTQAFEVFVAEQSSWLARAQRLGRGRRLHPHRGPRLR